MSWQEPKTNWKAGDTPNSGDFNRIEGNIKHTLEEAGKVNTVNNVSPDSNKNITLKPSDIGAVPTTRRVNGKALSSDIVLDGNNIKPIQELQLYCDSVNGSDSNDGLTTSTAFKTFGKAVEVAKSVVADEVKIKLAIGTYTTTNLQGIFANKITIVGDYSNKENITINGNWDLDYLSCKSLEFSNFKIIGTLNGINRAPVEVRFYNIILNGGVTLSETSLVVFWHCIIGSTMYPIDLQKVGVADIESNTLTGNYSCIRLGSVANYYVTGNDLNLSSKRADIGAISISSGSVGYASGTKGSLSPAPVFEVSSSILFKGKNDATGAADIKEKGGQIYDAT